MKQNISLEDAVLRMNEKEPELNAIITKAENPKAKTESGKLAGVPIMVKDNVSTKGLRTTASSKILENYVPVYNATIVDLLENEGAIIIAKTSMDELGMGGTNKNALYGPARNPHDTSRITGGSSGGSAAVVAAGIVPMAIGTDTGDSIRKPAGYCGVVGVKPTYGRISRYGIIPYASSLDTVGYFTSNIEDAALTLEVLAGRDDHDMTSSFLPVEDYAKNLNGSLEGKKIVIFENIVEGLEDEGLKKQWHDFAKTLEEAGAYVEWRAMPDQLMQLIPPVYKTLANAEATANHSNLDGLRFGVRKPGESVEEVMTESRTSGFSPYVRKRFVIGSYSLFEENQAKLFVKAQKIRRLIVEAYEKLLEDADVVLSPAGMTIAPQIDEKANLSMKDDNYLDEHMQLANFSGFPALTMPFTTVEGMPVGMHLAAHPFQEQVLFDTALGLENLVKKEAE